MPDAGGGAPMRLVSGALLKCGELGSGLFWIEDKRPVTNPLPPLDAIGAEIASDSAAGLEQFP